MWNLAYKNSVCVSCTHMADVHSPSTRSYNMSRIRSKNTKPEMMVRKFLHSNGFRYRLHPKGLPGKPDIVLAKYKTVIFVHGCFWHGHSECRYFKVPKTRTDWWLDKIRKNKDNDTNSTALLEAMGYKILIIWECNLKPSQITMTLQDLVRNIKHQFSNDLFSL